MKAPIFKGSCTAVVTPFSKGGIDYDKVGELIDLQYAGGIAALVICGTTGENATLSRSEQSRLVDFCIRYTNGRMKIIAGIGGNNTATALELALAAKGSGADGLLMVTPYYNKTSQAGLVKHFSFVAGRVDLPMIVYNVPSRTAIGIAAETYKELAAHPNINGVKEASGDFTLFSRARSLCGDDLFFWSGNDDNTVPMMSLGALGVISVASNIIPAAITQLCSLCLEGDFKSACALHMRYADLFSTLFIEVNPMPVKTAMNIMGMQVGDVRLPLCEMSPANIEKLRQSLRAASVIA